MHTQGTHAYSHSARGVPRLLWAARLARCALLECSGTSIPLGGRIPQGGRKRRDRGGQHGRGDRLGRHIEYVQARKSALA